jgi:hypothetical protein
MAYTTIDDPSAYFQTAIYSGNGSTQSITNDGNSDLQPDWIWFKNRTNSPRDHVLIDSTRGVDLSLYSNQTSGDQSLTDVMSSFDSDGFSLESNVRANESSQNHVAWQWKANGGTTASNSDGSITSTVQANTTAGFSIVTYTGNGSSGATIGHGLGAVPSMFIIKRRSGAEDWVVYHHKNTSAPETDHLLLNTTDATSDSDTRFNDTAPTSSLITMGNNAVINGSGSTYVAYVFAEKKGYSSINSYTGNGNADGTFVYTGFKPAWLMVKRTDSTNDWAIFDFKRDLNGNDKILKANTNEVEDTSTETDLLSNGFKMRSTSLRHNASGGSYIYMSFASSPFVSSDGVPTTAF